MRQLRILRNGEKEEVEERVTKWKVEEQWVIVGYEVELWLVLNGRWKWSEISVKKETEILTEAKRIMARDNTVKNDRK